MSGVALPDEKHSTATVTAAAGDTAPGDTATAAPAAAGSTAPSGGSGSDSMPSSMRQRRYVLGLITLLCVVVLWVASSSMIQAIFLNQNFNKVLSRAVVPAPTACTAIR